LDDALLRYRDDLLAKRENGDTLESAGPIVWGRRLASSLAPAAWRTITYGKGSWIVHMLRRRMGDEAFWKMIAALRREYEWKPVSTEDFRLFCARFLPPKAPDAKLEAFFDQWVYGTGIPSFKLTYSVKGKVPALKVVGTVKQTSGGDDFNMRVPVEVQCRGAKPVVQWVVAGSDDVAFTIPVRTAPSKVLLDPGNSVLKR
jgi:aminopeptidase N